MLGTVKKQVVCHCSRTDCQYVTAPHPLELDAPHNPNAPPSPARLDEEELREALLEDDTAPVSYTHLTLPTICSV